MLDPYLLGIFKEYLLEMRIMLFEGLGLNVSRSGLRQSLQRWVSSGFLLPQLLALSIWLF